MIDYVMQYGLFVTELVTVLAVIGAAGAAAGALAMRRQTGEQLEVSNLNRRYEQMALALKREALPAKAFKAEQKALKTSRKKEAKATEAPPRRRVFVVDFRGDIRATAVASLREEVSAVLTLANGDDEVLVRLENTGGLVHEHGLAASQLLRVRERGIPLTVTVDKVAASGGYMMACVADRILAAPFAILGSIGVLAQLPNFHRFLDARGIDYEQFKGGEYKRTVTLFGENTEADRTKFREEIEDLHALFRDFVAEHRPGLDIETAGTGEHWYGARALDLGLCDELRTSDDYLLAASRDARLLGVKYATKKPLGRRLAAVVGAAVERGTGAWWQSVHDGRWAA